MNYCVSARKCLVWFCTQAQVNKHDYEMYVTITNKQQHTEKRKKGKERKMLNTRKYFAIN